MTCPEVIDFLGAYLDGELAEDVRVRFDEHLGGCPECSAYLATYRSAVRFARDAFRGSGESLAADLPEDLVKAILAARRKT